jgi:hypothetical protein
MKLPLLILTPLALIYVGAANPGGCTPPPAGNPAATQPLITQTKISPIFAPDAQLQQPDAVHEVQYVIQLMVYRITLPAGAVSRSDDFWKRVDEHAVDIATYDLLFKNGVRVGVAQASEWDNIKEILGQNPAMTQPMTWTGRAASDIELEMRKAVPFQNVMYYDTSGELVGRTYERCNDLIRVSYQPAPRKHGFVRLGLVPVVQSMREQLVAVGPINTRTVTWFKPETLYELNLIADVGVDTFLVIAPSSEARWPSSLGNVFLTADAATERTETLLIIRPVMFQQRMEQPAPPAKGKDKGK